MSRAFQISNNKERHTETVSVFRYIADQTLNLYQEASWVWRDARGVRFAGTVLEPQAVAMEEIKERLTRQGQYLDRAHTLATEAERQSADAIFAMEEAEESHELGMRQVRESQDLAGHAMATARKAYAGSNDVRARVLALGSPPI